MVQKVVEKGMAYQELEQELEQEQELDTGAGAGLGDGKPPSSPDGDKPPPPSIDNLVLLWNKVPGVVHCRDINDARRKAYRVRAGNPQWEGSITLAMDKLAQSEFCQGINDSGWRADIDWFLKPDSMTRLLEGRYDNKPRRGQHGKQSPGPGQQYDPDRPCEPI
jgi:hypothetical protein